MTRAKGILGQIESLKKELGTLQNQCKHENIAQGYFSYRVGHIEWCNICEECGLNIGPADKKAKSWKELKPEGKYHCWFMHDNHTFVSVVGDLKGVYDQLKVLFDKDPHGGWGRLMDINDYQLYPDMLSLQYVKGLQHDLKFFEGLSDEDVKKGVGDE